MFGLFHSYRCSSMYVQMELINPREEDKSHATTENALGSSSDKRALHGKSLSCTHILMTLWRCNYSEFFVLNS